MKSPSDKNKAEQFEADNPAMSQVVEHNIRTIFELRQQADREQSLQDRIAGMITDFSGSTPFVYLHILWFGGWILINSGLGGLSVFDPFPYGLLTMIVSLEAIFLSTFVLISQNRMSAESESQNQLDLHVDLLTERELSRVLIMLEAIQQKLGIESGPDQELADLEKETHPEEVLFEIERLQERMLHKKPLHKHLDSIENPPADSGESPPAEGQAP